MGLLSFIKNIFGAPKEVYLDDRAPESNASEVEAPTPSAPIYNVIDVETPNHRNDRISSIAFTRMQGSEILWTKSTLVNPETSFDSFNTELTGISEKDVLQAPTFAQVWDEWGRDLQSGILVAHNALFDLSVLFKCCNAYKIFPAEVQYIDTLRISRDMLPQLRHHRLNDICNEFGIALNHHQADSDCRACAKILQKFINRGVQVNNYTCTFEQKSILQTELRPARTADYRNRKPTNLSEKTKCINELLSLLQEVSSDGKITEEEVHILEGWMNRHLDLKGNFPFDQIYDCVSKSLEDGKLEQSELQEILQTCLYLVDPVGKAAHVDHLDLEGKVVCISGQFDYGTNEAMTEFLTQRGAIVKPHVLANMDYLIVGNYSCKAWSSENYGSKVKKVIEWQGKGKNIQIVREDDLMDALQK
ncbi:MAG: exonuclease domain-containing protein [Faecalibacterium sp.]